MPDLALCLDHACPSAEKCLRHRDTHDPYGWYVAFERDGEDACDSYLPVSEKREDANLRWAP